MSIPEAVMEKLAALPPEQQAQVLRYVQSLASKRPKRAVNDSDPHPWLEVAMGMNLDGPSDWSERFEDYLNGDAGETGR